jgi:hypothetical protein
MTDDDIPLHLMYGANHLAMDEAFRARMHAAIEAGLETAPIGVVTTPGTSNPKYVPTAHPFATKGPEGSSSLPISTPNDERKKRPQADTRLGPTQLRRLLRPGNRMAEPPGYVINICAGPRDYNADHALVQ